MNPILLIEAVTALATTLTAAAVIYDLWSRRQPKLPRADLIVTSEGDFVLKLAEAEIPFVVREVKVIKPRHTRVDGFFRDGNGDSIMDFRVAPGHGKSFWLIVDRPDPTAIKRLEISLLIEFADSRRRKRRLTVRSE